MIAGIDSDCKMVNCCFEKWLQLPASLRREPESNKLCGLLHRAPCRVTRYNCDFGLFRVWQYTRPASDVSMLGEMMFGSVAMSYKGSTLKIHYIRWVRAPFSPPRGTWDGGTDPLMQKCISPSSFPFPSSPPQLMISKVFSARMGSFCGSANK